MTEPPRRKDQRASLLAQRMTRGPAPQVRSDETIGRPEDIGTHPEARPARANPYLEADRRNAPPAVEPKARVTLNLPAPMYRDIERWATDAAEDLCIPRVSLQDSMRAMLLACLTDPGARIAALVFLRAARADQGSAGDGVSSTALGVNRRFTVNHRFTAEGPA